MPFDGIMQTQWRVIFSRDSFHCLFSHQVSTVVMFDVFSYFAAALSEIFFPAHVNGIKRTVNLLPSLSYRFNSVSGEVYFKINQSS